MCKNLAPYAIKVWSATGGLVDGKPLICGGRQGSSYYDDCYTVTDISTKVSNMKNKRAYAASVVVNSTKLWACDPCPAYLIVNKQLISCKIERFFEKWEPCYFSRMATTVGFFQKCEQTADFLSMQYAEHESYAC